MARFSNGEEGRDYEARWCDRCVHRGQVLQMCPVWEVHRDHNYTADFRDLLDTLIPMVDGFPGECRMFVSGAPVEPALPEGVRIASVPMPVVARVRQEPEGSKDATVYGYKLTLPGWEHLDLYLTPSLAADGWWSVTEASTGYLIGESWDTKATAITSALLVLTVQGREQVDAMIAESREAVMP